MAFGRRSFLTGALATAAIACTGGDEGDPSAGTEPVSAPTTTTAPAPGPTLDPQGGIAYGPGPDQMADLHLPGGSPPAAGWPVVVLIHGGFWRDGFSRVLMTPLALSATEAGIAALNIDYRSSDHPDGGWPGTFEDVATAVDAVAALDEPLDPARVVAVGHSAGGHLALWAAARAGLPDGAPGATPDVPVMGAVALAAVSDLATCARDLLGDGACVRLMGAGPDQAPARYGLASPVERLPLGVPQVLVHGTADRTVPVSQSRTYAHAGREKGDPITYLELDGDGHFDSLDPRHPSWKLVLDALPDLGSVRP